jgi:tetratricopeptide (TPR) repeat protein
MDNNDEYNGIENIVEMLKAVVLRKGIISPYYFKSVYRAACILEQLGRYDEALTLLSKFGPFYLDLIDESLAIKIRDLRVFIQAKQKVPISHTADLSSTTRSVRQYHMVRLGYIWNSSAIYSGFAYKVKALYERKQFEEAKQLLTKNLHIEPVNWHTAKRESRLLFRMALAEYYNSNFKEAFDYISWILQLNTKENMKSAGNEEEARESFLNSIFHGFNRDRVKDTLLPWLHNTKYYADVTIKRT